MVTAGTAEDGRRGEPRQHEQLRDAPRESALPEQPRPRSEMEETDA